MPVSLLVNVPCFCTRSMRHQSVGVRSAHEIDILIEPTLRLNATFWIHQADTWTIHTRSPLPGRHCGYATSADSVSLLWSSSGGMVLFPASLFGWTGCRSVSHDTVVRLFACASAWRSSSCCLRHGLPLSPTVTAPSTSALLPCLRCAEDTNERCTCGASVFAHMRSSSFVWI